MALQTVLNQDYSLFSSGNLNGQANWELQANVAPVGELISSPALYVKNNTDASFIAASYDDTTLSNFNMSTMDFTFTVTFQRNSTAAISDGVTDYNQLILGNINADGMGTPSFLTVGIDYSGAGGGFSGNNVTPAVNHVNIALYDSDGNETDWDGTAHPSVVASWSAPSTLVWSRVAGTHTLSVNGVNLTPIPALNNALVTLNDIAWYSQSRFLPLTSPLTGVNALMIGLGVVSGLAATRRGVDVVVSWTNYANATSYKIYRDGVLIATHATPYTDSNAAAATHLYTVKAFDGSGNQLAQASATYAVATGGGTDMCLIYDDLRI